MENTDQRSNAGLNRAKKALSDLRGKKSIKDICQVVTISVDDELPPVDCYFRFDYDCPNAQTDIEERVLKLEHTEINGVEVKLNRHQHDYACDVIISRFAKTW